MHHAESRACSFRGEAADAADTQGLMTAGPLITIPGSGREPQEEFTDEFKIVVDGTTLARDTLCAHPVAAAS
jgi:hypothetical protein